MKILFFLKYYRDQASSRVRGFDLAEELRGKGTVCGIIHGYGGLVFLKFLLALLKYDVIYFQKRYEKIDLVLNSMARAAGKTTIFDIDDHPAGVRLSPVMAGRAEKMMALSSAVAAGSQNLKRLAARVNKNVFLIPSPVSLRYHHPGKLKAGSGRVTLGWVGNGIVYKEDLKMLLAPLRLLAERHALRLIIAGARGQTSIYNDFGSIKNVETEMIDWVSSADPCAIPRVIAEFDIGVYPLIDNEYNRYKCSLKALEYMAMEVPVVASPVGENKTVIEDGKDGFLPGDENEWRERLEYLINDKEARAAMGKNARKKVEARYSSAVCAEEVLMMLKTLREAGA